ncbi:MAG TPA: kelch repeat-containing protein, partial [bacterium]|nr:kelch repeat-containing protein [bacterium]
DELVWSNITPNETKPLSRSEHAMAYDRINEKLLLFGGSGEGLVDDDTWEWDGLNWNKLTEEIPGLRYGHSMAYNSTTGNIMLFGGYDHYEHPSGYFYDDTWEWNGSVWEQKTSADTPSARYRHAMAYDSSRDIVVLFGGVGFSMSNQDTWEWNGTNWVQRTGNTCSGINCYVCAESTCPSLYEQAAMVFDKKSGKTLLFGGRNYDGSNDETWEWDGIIWNKLDPENKPSARYSHTMTYDELRERVMLFGGEGGHQKSDELWEWSGTNWILHDPVKKPLPRTRHSIAYDSTRNKVILFGGLPGGAETWSWDTGAKDKPVQIINVAFASAGITDFNIQSLSVMFNAGGNGEKNGSLKNGADLLVWKDGQWVKVGYNEADPDNLSPVLWETEDVFEILNLLNSGSRKFNFAVTPAGTNGTLAEMGSVSTDYVEVAVRYKISD